MLEYKKATGFRGTGFERGGQWALVVLLDFLVDFSDVSDFRVVVQMHLKRISNNIFHAKQHTSQNI